MADEVAKQEYERKCKNWLVDFGRWTLPRSEAPETYIYWTGLFILSAVLRRRVFIPKTLLGSWSVAPNLYILFIAPAGRARKSTTANYVEDLLDNIPSITRAPELVTKERLLDKLIKSSDSSMCIVSPEFGEFIAKSGPSMFGFLTNMFDGKKKIDEDTFTRGAGFAEKPCVNLLGATTPDSMVEMMPQNVIGGGFASRTVFIYEERVRRRKIWYDDVDQKEMERLHTNLQADLLHIDANISGEYSLSKDAYNFMKEWYDHNAEGDQENYKLSGYYERKPAHVMKLAMLHHVAASDSMELQIRDFEDAIKQIEIVETKLPTVFQSLGGNPYTVDVYRMLDYIVEKGKVSRADIRRHFMHAAEPVKLTELMDGLIDAGYVEVELEGGNAWVTPSKALKVVK